MKKHNGFTLIELLITLTIAAILLSIGVPSFQYVIQSNRVSTQTNELVTALSVARTEAVRRNLSVRMDILDSDGDGSIDRLEVAVDDTDEVLRVFDGFGTRIDLDDADGNDPANTITFLATGRRDLSGDEVTYGLQPDDDCLGDMRREVTVALGGSTRTETMECDQ